MTKRYNNTGDCSLEEYTGLFLHLANDSRYPDSFLCGIYFHGLNISSQAQLSGSGPQESIAAYVDSRMEGKQNRTQNIKQAEEEEEQKCLSFPSEPILNGARKRSKRKTVYEKAVTKRRLEQERAKTRVNIGVAFPRWRQLRESKCLKTDAMVALFLLDSYEKSTTSTFLEHDFIKPPPPESSYEESEIKFLVKEEEEEKPACKN
ncbi:uncharacterized protein LOC122341401 [Puntigrus tetrazona]|uniref:uncharacterized protein LOC122341401 n=1 Tax=Puntigrus tetrazona TaxID=1606681 RepID=UPI001C8A3179|nr:uncharacterized protein LOC122341401 [Puntigrus tetrazona]